MGSGYVDVPIKAPRFAAAIGATPYPDGRSDTLDGDLAAVRVFNRAVSDSERVQLEKELMGKWEY